MHGVDRIDMVNRKLSNRGGEHRNIDNINYYGGDYYANLK
jgi:hypothetical protein